MPDDEDFDAMVEACCKAHEAVRKHGTAEMQAFMTALLHALAKEAARPPAAMDTMTEVMQPRGRISN